VGYCAAKQPSLMQSECNRVTAYARSPQRKLTHEEILQFIAEHEGTPAEAAHDLMEWMGTKRRKTRFPDGRSL
jgi:hypothetical protein